MGRHKKHELTEAFKILRTAMKRVHMQAVPAETIIVPPTLRELAQALGCSVRTAFRYLGQMEKRGWIRRHLGSRGIILLRRAAKGRTT